ncbi:MAG TPA: hypothetical protein VGC63_03250 [Solirubrobacterales bacterium]
MRAAVEDLPDVAVERGWEQEGDPGGYVALQSPRPDDLHDALAATQFDVEGIVELVSLPTRPMEMLSVHREHVVVGAFNFADHPLGWCRRCSTAHARGRHVKK